MIIEKRGEIMVYAGIVTFNPDMERLKENIKAVTGQVYQLVLVDNHSKNIKQIKELLKDYPGSRLIENKDNLGIARALNQIMEYSAKQGAEWVLTLDQDSVIVDGLVARYLQYIDVPYVGMMTCIFKDRNAAGFTEKKTDSEYELVPRCITSGCFTNVKGWAKSGGFDEKMFIDYVDYDMCMSMRKNGYIIIRINYLGLLHELGHSRDVRLFGIDMMVSNHAAFRKYYIIRNRIYYIRKHSDIVSVKKEIRHMIKYILVTMIYEPNKFKNFRAMVKGCRDGIKMR